MARFDLFKGFRPFHDAAIPTCAQTVQATGRGFGGVGNGFVYRQDPGGSGHTYLAFAFQMSWVAFQVPYFCFFQVQRYFPFSVTSLPSGPVNEPSYVPAVKPSSPLFEASA